MSGPLRLVAAMLFVTAVFAQEPSGEVTGRVMDRTGGVIPGATITLTGRALDRPRTVTTPQSGTFRLTAVPDGTYTLTVEISGFKKATQKVSVKQGQPVDVPAVVLEIAAKTMPDLKGMGLKSGEIALEFTTSLGQFALAIQRGRKPETADAFLKHLDLYAGGNVTPVVTRDQSTGPGSLEALALVERSGASDTPARVVILANEQVAAGPAREVIGRVWHMRFAENRDCLIAKIFQAGPRGELVRSPIAIKQAVGMIFLEPTAGSISSRRAP